MPKQRLILRLAIPAPLYTLFDYWSPAGCDLSRLRPGQRFKVPFGRRHAVGLLLETAEQPRVAVGKLKAALEQLDDEPIIDADMRGLMQWASEYYHYPIGEVMAAMLPPLLRAGRSVVPALEHYYQLSPLGQQHALTTLKRAPRLAAMLALLQQHAQGAPASACAALGPGWQATLRTLEGKGWVIKTAQVQRQERPPLVIDSADRPLLNAFQAQAVTAMVEGLGMFQAWVLDGVTGSGKTEVYLRIIEQVVSAGRQALVLVPEIGLTPQLVERFRRRFQAPLAILHSGLTDRERLAAWDHARSGHAAIVLGTRSAVFTPLARPGVIIIDEEHDASFKQQEGFRYHARDVAVWRAHRAAIPIILGSATPSLESLYNVERGRYRHLSLPQRAGPASQPPYKIVDLRNQALHGGLSAPLLAAVQAQIAQEHQVLLFLNRRGYAPTLLCHACGWVALCERCDAHMTLHQGRKQLCCHHCGAERLLPQQCADCGSVDLRAVGGGTERIEEALQALETKASILRIDRDTTRRKGALQAMLEEAQHGSRQILIGTQMLAKGHHLPNVTLVGIVDTDQGLYSADFRGPERMAQLIVQVAGRAGRAGKAGEVVIQTHHPDHVLLQTLMTQGYAAFAQAALQERAAAQLPPYSYMALLRAEAVKPGLAMDFLAQAKAATSDLATLGVDVLGPARAPMERRAGRYRAQLLLQAGRRSDLHRLLQAWLPRLDKLPLARRVRWSLDVDPMEMY